MLTQRRQFLTVAGSSTLVALSPGVPSFLLEAAAREQPTRDDRILVVIQLSGGNDGLNTVIPFGDDLYYRNRPTLAIARGQVRKIDDHLGLHPSMGGMSDLLEENELAIVQGVGYPNPNRSHFESMDLWHTAHRKSERESLGWIGRHLDASARDDGRDVGAIHFGGETQPLALAAERVRVPSIRSLDRFRLEAGDDPSLQRTIEEVVNLKRTGADDLLDFVQRSASAALSVSHRVEQASKNYKSEVSYPRTGLAQKLRTVAQLIDAGLSTHIYYLTLDGFDTHANQAPAHNGLLQQLSGAVAAFVKDIAAHGHGDRMLLMAFSEFGRRVKENASRGTDHGAAAPMFLAGRSVKPGVIGEHPSLTDLDDGDLRFHTDYRRVYATVLEKWLGQNSEPILGKKFEPMDLFT